MPQFYSIHCKDSEAIGLDASTTYVYPVDVCLSPSTPHSADASEIRIELRGAHLDNRVVAGCLMVGGGDCALLVAPNNTPVTHVMPAELGGVMCPASCGLDIMRECVKASGVPPSIVKFVASSLRDSSMSTCESTWKSWELWCDSSGEDKCEFSETALTSYLWFLFKERKVLLEDCFRIIFTSFPQPPCVMLQGTPFSIRLLHELS